MAVSGKIVHFDTNKGFGFLAPDEGGDDVFIHINDLDVDESQLKAGALVEFDVEDTDRGAKATNLVITQEAPAGAFEESRGRRDDHRPDRRGGFDRDRGDRNSDRRDRPRRPRGGHGSMDAAAFTEEITELLLDASGALTAAQIVAIRQRVTDFAVDRGWVLD
ncbi:cold shock domain-containing protein [Gordonia defluvii]|uniref:Cold shock domain-containing protein n=1 Tax=Gordonia defluvii TaxID=283718 RepID=A0ABP6L874_9ACTN|nr:cold shock domain-containing protein [Gordonia sp. UBA5067]